MRTGPRILALTVVVCAVMSSRALAADSLTVFVDNNQIALGGVTTIAAHAETDDGYGGGHVSFKYKPAAADCQPTPSADEGADAGAPEAPVQPVAPGAGATDVGGQMVQLDVGNWRICGWLIDDASGAVVAQGSTVVQVMPFMGSLSISVEKSAAAYQISLTYSTSSPGRIYAWLQRAAKQCPRNPSKLPRRVILVVPRGGRFIGSDGGLGRAIAAKRLEAGRWRVCAWLIADAGRVGPASKTFAVPRRPQRGARAAG